MGDDRLESAGDGARDLLSGDAGADLLTKDDLDDVLDAALDTVLA